MIEEKDLIPDYTSSIPDGPWLIFAPHPDDETFGMGGSILLASQNNIDIYVVVLTDGAKGGDPHDSSLVTRRIEEAKKAAKFLGIKRIFFWQEQDRSLQVTQGLIEKVADIVNYVSPSAVFFPSVLEPHPDHRATAAIVWLGIQRCPYFPGTLYSYEITVQGLVNYLIDISEVVSKKKSAIGYYSSQLSQNNYEEIISALDTARTLTLTLNIKAAEGFWSYKPENDQSLISNTFQAISPYLQLESITARPLVSIIVRTKDRKELLLNALESIDKQKYRPLEVIVVNDGGCCLNPEQLEEAVNDINIRYLELEQNTGRAHAGNVGLLKANGLYIGFLDDDDEYLPDHIETLVQGMLDEDRKVAYCKVDYIEQPLEKPKDQGKFIHTFGQCYDRNDLIVSNYIPFISLLFEAHLLKYLMLDEAFELYEDWDLLIRAGELTDFLFIDKVTSIYYQRQNNQIGFCSDQETIKRATLRIYRKHWSKIPADKLFDLRETNRFLNQNNFNLKIDLENYKEAFLKSQTDLKAITQSRSWRLISKYQKLKTWFLRIVKSIKSRHKD